MHVAAKDRRMEGRDSLVAGAESLFWVKSVEGNSVAECKVENTSSALPYPSEGPKRNRLGHESGYGFERKNFLAR